MREGQGRDPGAEPLRVIWSGLEVAMRGTRAPPQPQSNKLRSSCGPLGCGSVAVRAWLPIGAVSLAVLSSQSRVTARVALALYAIEGSADVHG